MIAKDIWYQTDSNDRCRNQCNPNSIYRALSYFLLTILADPIAFWQVILIEINDALILCVQFEMCAMILLSQLLCLYVVLIDSTPQN